MTIKARERFDFTFKHIFHATGLLTIAILAGIFLMLMYNSVAFFFDVQPLDFITRTQWSPESSKSQ